MNKKQEAIVDAISKLHEFAESLETLSVLLADDVDKATPSPAPAKQEAKSVDEAAAKQAFIAYLAGKCAEGHSEAIQAIIKTYNVKKVSDLPIASHAEIREKVEAL